MYDNKTSKEYALLKLKNYMIHKYNVDQTNRKSKETVEKRKSNYDRMRLKKFTDAEKKAIDERPGVISNYWQQLKIENPDEFEKRYAESAKKGLNSMNASVHECEYCGIKTTIGNYKRWHGAKCKKAQIND